MRFNSLVFLCFLAVTVIVLWSLPARWRRPWLLGASWFFYASWYWPFLLLLIGAGTINHYGAAWIMQASDRRRRGALVIAVNLLLLALFKYLDWLVMNANGVMEILGLEHRMELPRWILPLGLSFYLFECISYIVDIVRKREKLRSFWDFQLYIAYFPHLIAGPILRVKELIPQLYSDWRLRADDVRDGLWLLASGLFVKIVLADGIAPSVDAAFARAPDAVGSLDAWLMGAAFALQIYFDFAAYSTIAFGASLLCGLKLVENFNFPYSSRSPVEFWTRWHMSLSRWIRDYLFYPLVGQKATLPALCRAALISMTLCGIWHGAGWTFVLWGLYHGALIAGYHMLNARKSGAAAAKVARSGVLAWGVPALQVAFTFALISLGWILFRSQSLSQAAELMSRALMPFAHPQRALSGTFYLHTAGLLALVWLAPFVYRRCQQYWEESAVGNDSRSLRWHGGMGLAIGLMLVFCAIYLRGQTAFIYFQF